MKNKPKVLLLLCIIISTLAFSACEMDTSVKEKPAISDDSQSEVEGTRTDYSESQDSQNEEPQNQVSSSPELESPVISLKDIPEYSSEAYVVLNGNVPLFNESDKTIVSAFEMYSDLDSLGRCGQAYANICKEIMPTEERGSIGSVKPSGWHTVKYNGLIDGKYLYNRCHLIGYQLAGENANEKNLITGTRYMNVVGMLYFEDMVDDYVDETGNHVLYRVTPIFDGKNLVASGVQMEAWSVEDAGKGICFNVYCYNVQPGIEIDYATGDSCEAKHAEDHHEDEHHDAEQCDFIINKNTKKFHRPDCRSVGQMKEKNKKEYTGTYDELIEKGYEQCKNCF